MTDRRVRKGGVFFRHANSCVAQRNRFCSYVTIRYVHIPNVFRAPVSGYLSDLCTSVTGKPQAEQFLSSTRASCFVLPAIIFPHTTVQSGLSGDSAPEAAAGTKHTRPIDSQIPNRSACRHLPLGLVGRTSKPNLEHSTTIPWYTARTANKAHLAP